MHMKKTLLAALTCAASLAASQTQAQTTITDWTFASDAVAVNYNPVPEIGAGIATALGMTNTYGTPGASVGSPDIVATGGSSTSTPDAWRIRGVASGSTAANGWSSLAPVGTQGGEFQVSTVGYNNVQVSFDLYSTTQGERNVAVLYTLNGTSWIDANITSVPTGDTILNNTGSDANTITGNYIQLSSAQGFNNGITVNLSGVSGANNDPNFGIEVVNASTGVDDIALGGSAYNNSSGNWRFDNVAVSGVSTVPEPQDLALVGLGLAGIAGWRGKFFRKK
jgi:PEP-CTERM motif